MEKEMIMEKEKESIESITEGQRVEAPAILEEITVEELAVDGICGIY